MSVIVIERHHVEDVSSSFMFHGYSADVMRRTAILHGDLYLDALAVVLFAAKFDPTYLIEWAEQEPK